MLSASTSTAAEDTQTSDPFESAKSVESAMIWSWRLGGMEEFYESINEESI